MAVTITPYDHTTQLIASGQVNSGDTFLINLYSAFTFTAADTTKAAAETGATQLTTANGYTQDTKTLSTVSVTTVTTNDAKFDADDVSWTASGGDIGPATYAAIYADTLTNDPPLFYIDFGQAETAVDGTAFKIVWDANGIITLTYT